MRHATSSDLDRLRDLLAELRGFEPLRERKPGNFQYRSRAFLHFHADGEDLFADVRLAGSDFERRRVTTAQEQTNLLAAIASLVGGPTG